MTRPAALIADQSSPTQSRVAAVAILQADLTFDMRFLAYIIGFLILIAGLAWAAIEAGAPVLWVQIGAVILFGIGIITGASRTRAYRTSPDVTVVHDKDVV